MLFSSIEFLYYFLPIVIALYFIVPKKFKNLILLLSSLFFYFWGEPVYTLIMIAMAFSGYIHGLLIDKFRGTIKSKIVLVSSIVVGIGCLGFFKYSNFFIENINGLSSFILSILPIENMMKVINFAIPTLTLVLPIDNISEVLSSPIPTLALALPIGISFYTFQILSYTIDLYRGKYGVQKNFIDFFTYVALFPQLIAGPIVRYSDVDKELKTRTHSFENFAYGVNRFLIGLSKKILIADVLASFCNLAKDPTNSSVLFMWAYAIAYAIHIYFDFSGYSDMAIGLGRIFGFNFPENFNYPYISKSITEFWRRWHMTLGSWFRDYVYIPLGGNRVSKLKWIRNIFVVWFLTGFWHGAGWNFIAWGLLFAILLLLEKIFLAKVLEKIPTVFKRIYVIFFLLISWIIFDAASLTEAFGRIGNLFGFGGLELVNTNTLYYIRSYAVVFILGLMGCTPIVKNLVLKLKSKETGKKIINILEPLIQVALLVLATSYIIDGSFSPFLYFRF